MKQGDMIVDQRFVKMCRELGLKLNFTDSGECDDVNIRHGLDVPRSCRETLMEVASRKCPECGNSVSLAIVNRGQAFFPADCYDRWKKRPGGEADAERLTSEAEALQKDWREMLTKIEGSTETMMEEGLDD